MMLQEAKLAADLLHGSTSTAIAEHMLSTERIWNDKILLLIRCADWCRYVVIAGAVAHFYWNKGQRSRMPRFPVALALKNTIL